MNSLCCNVSLSTFAKVITIAALYFIGAVTISPRYKFLNLTTRNVQYKFSGAKVSFSTWYQFILAALWLIELDVNFCKYFQGVTNLSVRCFSVCANYATQTCRGVRFFFILCYVGESSCMQEVSRSVRYIMKAYGRGECIYKLIRMFFSKFQKILFTIRILSKFCKPCLTILVLFFSFR